ncbi:MAG: beta-lactamase family protein [Acidobacteriaceae bacterium]|nr:beta-lactamase family protein [Acidobacteriaceae bacterium]
MHVFAGITWPLALAQYRSTAVPALVFDAPVPPVAASDFPKVMNRDMASALPHLDLAAADGGAGIVIGVSTHGVRRILTYGTAKPDSLFEIGSITKTFTGLLLSQMGAQGRLDLRDSVRDLLPARTAAYSKGFEITLLDLATHHSGLPRMPDNTGPENQRESFTNYHASDLYDFVKSHGLERPANADFLYSNIGFAVLGAALASRAGISYQELLRRDITEPLGMKDTAITLSPEQRGRLLQGYGYDGHPTPSWDLDAFASAGGIRSTAGDMLTYLEAQLHPEKTPFRAALLKSQKFRDYVTGDVRIALAWMYDPATGVFAHDGATGGFTSYTCFDPHRDFAAVILLNAHPGNFPMLTILGEHVRQRLAGEPALSLTPISVAPPGPLRSFLAYWIAMIVAGVFTLCCVLTLQGIAAQLLPRRWFLHASTFLQLAVFCVLLSAYSLQRAPAAVLINGPHQPWLAWIPSYWFVGLYQQLSGSLHPALRPFALRAWAGLFAMVFVTAAAYAASYFRTLSKIVDEPDIAPGIRSNRLPRLGGLFETAVIHFSVRSLLRSRRHRMIFAFYIGVGLAFAILFLNAPRELSGPAPGGPWESLSVPLLASTVAIMGVSVIGARKVFSLPLDLRANWIFQAMPVHAGQQYLRARRRALLAVSVAPVCGISAALLFCLWPWHLALAHLAVLLLLGIILSEFSFDGVQRIPFTCSYLPGKSKLYLTFWVWIWMLLAGVIEAAIRERHALQTHLGTTAILLALGLAAVICMLHNNWLAHSSRAELRFEEVPVDQLLSLNLS